MTEEEKLRKKAENREKYKHLIELGAKYRFKPGHANVGKQHITRVNRLTEVLRKCMNEEIEVEDFISKKKKWMKIEHAVALRLLKRALDGNLRAIEIVFDRVDGKVKEKLELEDVTESVEVENKITYNFNNLTADELLYLRNVMLKLSPNNENNLIEHDVPGEEIINSVDLLVEDVTEKS